jgi:glycosyltransferase involved in cell wall biosynthesis
VTDTVSAVIPTVGRPSLRRAVQSALSQSTPVREVIVVLDADRMVDLPEDDRITLLRTTFDCGPAVARQVGIDAARGSIVAMLDDDDEWLPTKTERQLEAVRPEAGGNWIASSRISARGPGARQRTWPRRLIKPEESIPEYLFRFTGLRAGGSELQSSTLMFPTQLARRVRWDSHDGTPHDEPSWLIRAQRSTPDLRVIQLPEVLSIYNVDGESVSRQRSDCTARYIDWGLQHLSSESPRVLGDYLCTYPVSAAVSAKSLPGAARAVQAAARYGRPGGYALGYAALNAIRIILNTISAVRR